VIKELRGWLVPPILVPAFLALVLVISIWLR
jgi:hypothetical protein